MWGIVATVLGTLLGLVGMFVGAGKVVPVHPMYPLMVEMFDTILGHLQAMPGSALRVFAAVFILAGSLGMLIGLYVELLGLMGDSIEWVEALMVCAPVGLIGLFGYAGCMDTLLGRFPAPFVLAVLWVLVLVSRLKVTPIGGFPRNEQTLIEVFSGVTVVVLILCAVVRGVFGAPREPLKSLAAKFDAKMNGQTDDAAADVEQPLK